MVAAGVGITRLLRFDSVLLDVTKKTWATPGFVALDRRGHLLSIGAKAPTAAKSVKAIEKISGIAIPGMVNSHSHAFQYAMAGLTERLAPGHPQDTFWTWRERMYALALELTPEDVAAITTAAYAEMLRHGYTSVVEFHYLHHQPNGKPYKDPLELSNRILDAATMAGIDLTLAPVFYNQSDFGKAALPEQRRFLSKDPNAYLKLWSAAAKSADTFGFRTALAVHSLRAAKPEHVQEIFGAGAAKVPRHLHIAEQEKEVRACMQALGRRPVQWALENLEVGEAYHFTHGTHINAAECTALAASKAGVILCPSTEGNLGDGFFPLSAFVEQQGRFAIGSDSHIGLSPFEELRWLEYGQRLQAQKRNVVLSAAHQDSGSLLYGEALGSGRRCAGLSVEPFKVGDTFNAAVVDTQHHQISGSSPDMLMSTLVFGPGSEALLGTIVGGKWQVKAGRHMRGPSIFAAYKKVVQRLRR